MLKMFKHKYSPQPKIGDKIKITWLASCKNVSFNIPNPYIGMKGVVDYLYDNGGFCINTGTSVLCIINNKFNYESI